MERDPSVEEEEAAAAREAGAIGGEAPEQDLPPEDRPVAEGGGGVAEGFELAEDALVESSSHGDQHNTTPILSQSGSMEEEDPDAEYGEPDEVDPTEPVRNPADPDDPGTGPGLAADR